MKSLVILLLALLSAGALCAQTTHPPTMASASLPTCDVSRDGTFVSLVDASTTLDCNTTGGGNVTATCKCEQQSAGVFAWVGVATGAHTVDTDTDDQDGAEVPLDDVGGHFTTDNVEEALQQVGPTMANARTPTTHASTHADGQSDELTGTHGIDITGNAATATVSGSGDTADNFFTLGTIAAARLPAVTALSSLCTDIQVLGGTAAGTGVECQLDQIDGGAASTANSFSSNPANCALGLAAPGVDANGAGEDCFDVLTQAEGDALNLALDNLGDNNLDDLLNVTETGEAVGRALVGTAGGDWGPSSDEVCLQDGTNCPASGGGSSSGTGLQYGDGAGGFTEVASSSVSGANVTLGGPLAIGTTALLLTPTTPSGASGTTDRGYTFGTSPPAALVTEVSGGVLTLGINAAQIGARDTTKTGAIFRLDSRSANVFDVLTHATGASVLTSRFTISSAGSVVFNPGGANPAVTINGTTGNITFTDGIISSSRNPMYFNFGASNNDINFSNGKMLWEGDNQRLCIGCANPSSTLDVNGITRARVHSFSVADNGAGTKAASTLTPTSSYVECSCLDTHGCDVTMGETALQGQSLIIVNIGTNACDFADTGGISELPAGGVSLGTNDSLSLIYASDRWITTARSDN